MKMDKTEKKNIKQHVVKRELQQEMLEKQKEEYFE